MKKRSRWRCALLMFALALLVPAVPAQAVVTCDPDQQCVVIAPDGQPITWYCQIGGTTYSFSWKPCSGTVPVGTCDVNLWRDHMSDACVDCAIQGGGDTCFANRMIYYGGWFCDTCV